MHSKTVLFPKALTLLLLVIVAGARCQLLQKIPLKPDFSFERIEFVGFTLEAAKLRLYTKVSNPYPVAMPKARLLLKLRVEGVALADLQGEEKTIPARSVAPVQFDVSIPYASLGAIYKRFPGKESLEALLAGQLDIPVPPAARLSPTVPKELSFKFEAKRTIPAVLPSLSIRNFRIIKPNADDIRKKVTAAVTKDPEATVRKAISFFDRLLEKGTSPGSAAQAGLEAVDIEVRTEFEIVMTNEAAARLDFRQLRYSFFLNDEQFLEGNSTSIENQGRTTVIKVETKFPLKSVSAGISSAISSRSIRYRLNGSAGVSIPALSGEIIAYDFDKSAAHRW